MVQSWGTLYAITALTDEKFKVLCERYKLDDPDASAPILTQSMVEAVRKEKTEKSSLKVYATIYVDVDAMKAGLFDGDHIATLEESLDTLRRRCLTSRSRSQASRSAWRAGTSTGAEEEGRARSQ